MIPHFHIRHVRDNLRMRRLLSLRQSAMNRDRQHIRDYGIEPIVSGLPLLPLLEIPEDWNLVFTVDTLANDDDEFYYSGGPLLLTEILEKKLGYENVEIDYDTDWSTIGSVRNTKGYQPSQIRSFLCSNIGDFRYKGWYEDEYYDDDGILNSVLTYVFDIKLHMVHYKHGDYQQDFPFRVFFHFELNGNYVDENSNYKPD